MDYGTPIANDCGVDDIANRIHGDLLAAR